VSVGTPKEDLSQDIMLRFDCFENNASEEFTAHDLERDEPITVHLPRFAQASLRHLTKLTMRKWNPKS
jgi:hypothetical protein